MRVRHSILASVAFLAMVVASVVLPVAASAHVNRTVGPYTFFLVLIEEPTFPGCHIRVRPIGKLVTADEKGEDEKILSVPLDDPHFTDIHDLTDLPSHWQREIATFFRTYKELQGVETEVRDWFGAEAAWEEIATCQQRYDETATQEE